MALKPSSSYPTSFSRGLADGDGDGDVDLLVNEYDDHNHLPNGRKVVMWLNDGAAGFAHSDRFVLDTEEELSSLWLLAGQPLGEAVRLLWYPRVLCWGHWRLTRPWAASQPPPLFFDAEVNPCNLHLLTDLGWGWGSGVGWVARAKSILRL